MDAISIVALKEVYFVEMHAESQRWWRRQGPLHISAWNPQVTARMDADRNREHAEHMRRWAEHWCEQHGLAIEDVGAERFRVMLQEGGAK